MKLESKSPFQDYTCYKVFHKKMKRWQVCLVHRTGYRRTILYSKFLMSIKLGRMLLPTEEVDHIDGNKQNDSISNLEVVTRDENVKRHVLANPAIPVELICANCGCVFYRPKNRAYSFLHLGKQQICSRRCVYESQRNRKLTN